MAAETTAMGYTSHYRTTQTVDSSRIAALDVRLKTELPGYVGFGEQESQTLYLENLNRLPELPRIEGAQLGQVSVNGYLDHDPLPTFREVLSRGRKQLRDDRLGVSASRRSEPAP